MMINFQFDFTTHRFPFNWRNPFGFCMAVYIQYITCKYILIFVSCTISLGIGPFLLMITLTEDIEINARAVNACAKNEKTQSQTLQKISVFIQSYSSAKQLSINVGF